MNDVIVNGGGNVSVDLADDVIVNGNGSVAVVQGGGADPQVPVFERFEDVPLDGSVTLMILAPPEGFVILDGSGNVSQEILGRKILGSILGDEPFGGAVQPNTTPIPGFVNFVRLDGLINVFSGARSSLDLQNRMVVFGTA